MKIGNLIFAGVLASIFGGCVSTEVRPVSNKAMTAQKLQQKSDMELLDAEEEYETEASQENKELYFSDTKGKIFYSGVSGSKTDIEYRTGLLLNDLFLTTKNKLPKISRKKRLNISLEISQNSVNKDIILDSAQNYILSKKRYALVNSDEKSLKILQKVLKREQDSIYNQNNSIKSRDSSDIILLINSSQSSNSLRLKAKIISKNGELLGQKQIKIDLKNNKQNEQWIEVKVPRVDAPAQLFEVMRVPVTKQQYRGVGGSASMSNISYISANSFCTKNMKGELLHPYIFEHARRTQALRRPSSGANIEIMAPYDEEDHEIYFQDGDSLESEDSSIVAFHWNGEKYFAVSNLFKSPKSTFRCMRAK